MDYAPAATMIATPIGQVRIEADGDTLIAIRIGDTSQAEDQTAVLREAVRQLEAYFSGKLSSFDLPVASPSTRRGIDLREAICAVRFGETRTYGEIAKDIRSSARAIGQACGRNAFPIIVPCHRILSAGSRLGHYSAGAGLPTKAYLLKHERAEGWLL